MKYIPSKKLIVKSLIALLIAGGIFWFFVYKKLIKSGVNYKKSDFQNRSAKLNKDTDNDGLKDWEEALYKTAPNNPDTDNDGTADGEEIKLNRDPLKPGPDDVFEINNEEESEAKTLTQQIGRDFLLKYLSMKNIEEMSEAEKNELVNSMLSRLAVPKTEQKKYGESDIKITDDNSKENIKNYINSLGKIFKTFKVMSKTDLEILNEILADENEERPEKIKELKANRMIYEKVIYEMARQAVPSNYKNIHLSFLNIFSNTSAALGNMEFIYDDPAKALVGIKEYFGETNNLINAFRNFEKQIKNDEVKISPTEEGYIFIRDYFPKIR